MDEFERLRRRAYGSDADIAGDAAAQARLSELEAAQRRQGSPVVDAAAWVPAPAPERVKVFAPDERLTNGGEHDPTVREAMGGQPPTASERADWPAPNGDANSSPPAALATQPRVPHNGRVRRILPWVIAAVSVLVAAIAIAIGVPVVNESSEPQPVARLTALPGVVLGAIPVAEGEDFAGDWDPLYGEFVSYGSYGRVEIWSTVRPEGDRCLAVVVSGRTVRFNCTLPTFDTIADINLQSSMLPRAPSGEPVSNVRFVLHDDVVDVYLAPNPEGGFY